MKLSLGSIKKELNVTKDEDTSLGNEIASLTLQVVFNNLLLKLNKLKL